MLLQSDLISYVTSISYHVLSCHVTSSENLPSSSPPHPSHPVFASHLAVQRGRHVSCNPRSEGVEDDEGGVRRAAVVRVEHPDEREQEDEQREHEQLHAHSNHGAEETAKREAQRSKPCRNRKG